MDRGPTIYDPVCYHIPVPVREIIQLGNPLLREKSRPVKDFRAAAQTLADLRDTLHDFQQRNGFGRGISAVQIGVPERLIYLEIGGRAYKLVNPALRGGSHDRILVWDDCFSFPQILVRLVRAAQVEVDYVDPHGVAGSVAADGDFSELLQHELDHLDGILAIDRAINQHSFATRAEYERRYARERVVTVGGKQ
ncbi:MAG: peptide deformylase [Acidobacteria bacterium]|nr:peptide deformylase [Acidobacteriota bacterium]